MRSSNVSPGFDERWLLLPISVLLLQLGFLFPLLWKASFFLLHSADIGSYSPVATSLWRLKDGVSELLRTLTFSAASAFLQTSLGFAVALFFVGSDPDKLTRWLSLLLLPALVGDVAVGFVYKDLPVWIPSLQQRGTFHTWAALVIVQTWQFLPMCIYLFLLRSLTIRGNMRDFSRISGLSRVENVRHVVWPHCRNLAFVLALFAFLQGVAEFSKTDIMFGASSGTKTEMMSHWIDTHEHQLGENFPSQAQDLALAYGGILLATTLVSSVGVSALIILVIGQTLKGLARIMQTVRQRTGPPVEGVAVETSGTTRMRWIVGVTAIAVAVLPFGELVYDLVGRQRRVGLDTLANGVSAVASGLPAVLLAAVSIAGVTIACGVILRLLAPRLTEKFDEKSLPMFSGILLLHAAPGVALAYCALHWFHVLVADPALIPLYWLLGESILGLSVIGAFILYVHFDVPSAEIAFYRSSGASVREAFREGFWSRFRLSYLLVGLFAFSIVISEDAISSVLYNFVPTVIVRLRPLASGRGSDYPQAAVIVLLTIALILVLITLWNSVLVRSNIARKVEN